MITCKVHPLVPKIVFTFSPSLSTSTHRALIFANFAMPSTPVDRSIDLSHHTHDEFDSASTSDILSDLHLNSLSLTANSSSMATSAGLVSRPQNVVDTVPFDIWTMIMDEVGTFTFPAAEEY